MLKLAEDRETGGLFNNWFGKKSKYSLEFRLTTRIFATYVLHQVNLFIEIESSHIDVLIGSRCDILIVPTY